MPARGKEAERAKSEICKVSPELHRLFKTGCNPGTVAHIVGNFRSCWEQLKGMLISTKDNVRSGEQAEVNAVVG